MGFLKMLMMVLVGMVVAVSGQEYELDQDKLAQRYDLIHQLVSSGIPGKGGYGASRKPKIGSGYSNPNIGYKRGTSLYAPSQSYGGYNKPYTGYGLPTAYSQASRYAPSPYGRSRSPYGSGGFTIGGIRLGRGHVHPIFNNNNLYKPKQTYPNTFSDYNNQEPIYVGGDIGKSSDSSYAPDLFSKSGYPQKPAIGASYTEPQVNAYGSQSPGYSGYAGGGPTYTDKAGTIYGGLPGYSDPYLKKY